MFKGTGSNSSKQIANSLIIVDGTDTKFVNLEKKENQMKYIEDNWNLFNISLVSRRAIPIRKGKVLKFKDDFEEACKKDDKLKKQYEIIKPWIYETTDNGRNNPENKIKLKRALHIRMK